jgi:hypothetical protein
MTSAGNQETESGEQRSGARLARASLFAWLAIAAFLLLAPVFAHGCHGDDVDHEPFLIPIRITPDDP